MIISHRIHVAPLFTAVLLMVLTTTLQGAAAQLDSMQFGVEASESAHNLKAHRSRTITGGLNQPARQLLPLDPPDDYGGHVSFDMAVDPDRPTYFTIKLWGSDAGQDRGRLLLFCEGKQVGIRHLGEVGPLDIASDDPRFPGRFTYVTTVLPRAMTAGKQKVRIEIRALGRIWGYGNTWDRFQKKLEQPSRGIYATYTHNDPFFVPPADEVQGDAPADAGPRTTPGPEILDAIKQRVSNEVHKILRADSIDQMRIQFLAHAYHVRWTPAYHNPASLQRILQGLDALYLQYKANPELAQNDPKTWNADWFGFGPAADALRLLADELQPMLDEPVDGIPRREAYAQMFLAAREWHRQHRRLYTNQSMIKDLYGIYLANRGLQIVAPDKAMPEAEARRYLYESVGLQPWLGNDNPDGTSQMPLGPNYMQLTNAGLTKELGYVGSYGEVLDWIASIYDATRPRPGAEGDPKIKQQLARIARARAVFRYPLIDTDGHRAMAVETVIGWRDDRYPGYITYAQRPTRDGGPFQAAVATMDPVLLGYARQMLDDGQFFAAMHGVMQEGGFRVTAGLLHTPDHYEIIRNLPAGDHHLPMTPGEPDFVFSDEENGVVAIKHGDDILYASLYWRARQGINYLARVHYLTPTIERDATVWQEVFFDDSGMAWRRDDRTIEAQTRRHEKSRGDLQQAMEGEVLPIAKIPPAIKFKPGDESIYAGKGTFYILRYGPYLIAMNLTTDRTFDLVTLDTGGEAKDLKTNRPVLLNGAALQVGPRSTVVLYLNSNEQ